MKYIGGISLFFESKGYGFINSCQLTADGYGKDIFFHISDCTFTPKRYAYVIFELKKSKDKIKAINVKIPTQEVEYLIDNWSRYSDGDKSKCIAAFLQDWKEDLVLRKKLVEAANRYTEIEDEKLQDFFSSVSELALIESGFDVDCKKIIADIVSDVFLRNYADYDFSFSTEIPSVEELNQAVLSFWQDFKPTLRYTHTYEDSYWRTHWKWDGSEDYLVDGKDEYVFKSANLFTIKGISIDLNFVESGSGSYDKDINDVKLRMLSDLMNRQSLWSKIDFACKRKSEQLQKSVYDNLCSLCKQPILDELSNFFTTKYPKYGALMFKWIAQIYGRFWMKDINEFKVDALGMPYNHVCFIKKGILETNGYISTSISNLLKSKSISLPESYIPMDDNIIERDGMRLSADGKTLYAINDSAAQEVIIPDSVSVIADRAFSRCGSLKKIQFLGSITHIGHGVWMEASKRNDYRYYSYHNEPQKTLLEVDGDFSKISFFGYNTSLSKLSINGEIKTIKEWSYIFNKMTVDSIVVDKNEIHIAHNDE